jgi:reductive dehalogenase
VKQVENPTYEKFITGPLQRFDDRNSGFSRLERQALAKKEDSKNGPGSSRTATDKIIRGNASKQQRKGYMPTDYAMIWASRKMDYLVRGNLYSRDIDIGEVGADVSDKTFVTKKVKEAAGYFGADLVGICKVNPNWIFSHWGDFNAHFSGGLAKPGDPIEIPPWFKYAVVLCIAMDYEKIKRSPAVEPSTYLAYAQMAFVSVCLATFIRQLGFHAMPSGNDLASSIPLAIDAGLGELGRHGMLITEEFGPRVRIAKVFTDLPLETDKPVDLGVQHFCETCERCAEDCPSGAMMHGDRTDQPWDESNNVNVLKWPIKTMKCINWWEKNQNSCANCIRVCSFNKPKGMLHNFTRKIIRNTSAFDHFLIWMDKVCGYGKQVLDE